MSKAVPQRKAPVDAPRVRRNHTAWTETECHGCGVLFAYLPVPGSPFSPMYCTQKCRQENRFKLQTDIPTWLIERLRELADEAHVKVTDLVRDALYHYVEEIYD